METDPTRPIGDIQKETPGLTDEYIEIGNTRYLLSKEAQRFLKISPLSDLANYDHSSSILTIQEPHERTEGHFNLFKGLEIFFKDNPALVRKTIFLAEGTPAHQPILMESLIKEEPHPSDELIMDVLNSFLITGYMAFEWKHQSNIPIIGTENKDFYEMSRTFLLWMMRHPEKPFARGGGDHPFDVPIELAWYFSLIARNQSMVDTLSEVSKRYENPILFVGGKHFGRLQKEEFDFIKNMAPYGMFGPFGPYCHLVERATINNFGLYDLLKDAKIGFTFLDPIVSDAESDQARYQDLFSDQHKSEYLEDKQNIDYQNYIAKLLAESKSSKGITVKSSPEAAAEYVRALKEKRKTEEQLSASLPQTGSTSGVIYERKETDIIESSIWQTKTEELPGVGSDLTGTFERSLPQQNEKIISGNEVGEHTFYDPRNQRSGKKFKDADQKS